MPGQVVDYLPLQNLIDVRNVYEFTGMLCVDKWSCNVDARQAVFHRRARERRYSVCFIDQGYCFNGGDWTFPDSPLRGKYARDEVYRSVTGWRDFEPWIDRLEQISEEALRSIADDVPSEWYDHDNKALEYLIERLLRRRFYVRDLILSLRHSDRSPFPNWPKSVSVLAPRSLAPAPSAIM